MSADTQEQQQETQVVAKAPPRPTLVVQDSGPMSYMMDTARWEHINRIGTMMANCGLIPQHLKGKSPQESVANCLLVINQALRWDLDPFAVAAETYVVSGKLGFQGKLVAAVVNARAGLDGRLRYEFSGVGQDRTVKVMGRFRGDESDSVIEMSVKQAKTSNKLWETDPDQKLVYSAVTKWARRFCPEVMLGILIDSDLERMVDDGVLEGTVAKSKADEAKAKLAERQGKANDAR